MSFNGQKTKHLKLPTVVGTDKAIWQDHNETAGIIDTWAEEVDLSKANLQAMDEQLKQSVELLDEKASSQQVEISILQETSGNAAGDIASVEKDVRALYSAQATITGQVEENGRRLNAMQVDVNRNNKDIALLQGDMAAAKTNISKLDSEAVKVGDAVKIDFTSSVPAKHNEAAYNPSDTSFILNWKKEVVINLSLFIEPGQVDGYKFKPYIGWVKLGNIPAKYAPNPVCYSPSLTILGRKVWASPQISTAHLATLDGQHAVVSQHILVSEDGTVYITIPSQHSWEPSALQLDNDTSVLGTISYPSKEG